MILDLERSTGETSMKLVIAGASGFIGSLLVQRLGQRGDGLVLLSRKPRSMVAAYLYEAACVGAGRAGGLGRVHRWRRRG